MIELEMESAGWLKVGRALDSVQSNHDKAVNLFVKSQWERLDVELLKIAKAVRRARTELKKHQQP